MYFLPVLFGVSIVGCGPREGRHGEESMADNSVAFNYASDEDPSTKETWEIRVPAGASREFIYTNKIATHFSGEAVRSNSRSYHGLFCSMHEYLDSWELFLNGTLLDQNRITEALVYPHTIYRVHAGKGVMEEILLPDEFNGLVVQFNGIIGGEHEFVPWVDMRHIWDTPKPEYRIFWEKKNNTLLISRVDNPFPTGQPRWLAVTANVQLEFVPDERVRPTTYPKDAARRAMAQTFPFSPGRLRFAIEPENSGPVTFVFFLGKNEDDAARGAGLFAKPGGIERARREKLSRMNRLLERVDISGEDEEHNKALRWALVSMDNMIMKQRGTGIYAGFHWFPNYWGRDSFICLPGACLVTGAWEESREIILSFVEHQQTDPASPRLGRFPNIVNPDNLQYAGVDGTWWLVRAAWKNVIANGDPEILVNVFPHVRLAIEGALEKATDDLGFLTHGNGETWMDAGGESNPYSPRGNRAVEVQALFHHGLLAGAAWARTLAAGSFDRSVLKEAGVDTPYGELDPAELESLAGKWERQAALLRENFRTYFWDEKNGYLYDHLNEDGTPDGQIRPNAVLALWVSLDSDDLVARVVRRIPWSISSPLNTLSPRGREKLIDRDKAKAIVKTAMATIVLPHGVASLSPDDPRFHPYHLDLDCYFFDEAYHNGDVWEWLTGPMVTCMRSVGEEGAASKLVAPLVDEILFRGCVGSLREIRDGVYTEGKEEFGGATSQAWSLAEFIRVCLTE
jgi:glycogen debranching enzyme